MHINVTSANRSVMLQRKWTSGDCLRFYWFVLRGKCYISFFSNKRNKIQHNKGHASEQTRGPNEWYKRKLNINETKQMLKNS